MKSHQLKVCISAIKVLILSIYESKRMVEDSFGLGAQGYCVKDVGSKELIKAVSDTIEGKEHVCHKSDMQMIFSGKNSGCASFFHCKPCVR
jgi:two-component system nitrate/nitrite response regulator NarL